ncbi:MAG: KpsF/GutQ family sugar-phosphate isomerase [Planctomycetota bacterium]
MTIQDTNRKLEARLEHAREVIRVEARAISNLDERLGDSFSRAIDLILGCEGVVVVTGMGKAGLIAQKVSATLASTGTPSIFLHPAEALHGDLGRIRSRDLVLALSNSGETVEIKLLVPAVRKIGARLIAMTGMPDSTLGHLSDVVLDIGPIDEACPLGLAPTASTSALLALGDALAMVVSKERNFSREEYALYHPAGALGRKLMHVGEVMRKGRELPLCKLGTPLHEVLRVMSDTPGRPGVALIVDQEGRLIGIFTDGDFRRRFKQGEILRHEDPIDPLMTRHPKYVQPDELVQSLERMMKEHHVDQMPVIDASHKPVGLVDVQDLLDTHV